MLIRQGWKDYKHAPEEKIKKSLAQLEQQEFHCIHGNGTG